MPNHFGRILAGRALYRIGLCHQHGALQRPFAGAEDIPFPDSGQVFYGDKRRTNQFFNHVNAGRTLR